MSRRRYVSTLVSIDKHLRRLSDGAALLYTWMIPHCEDDATITADFDEIASMVVPNRPGWTIRKIEAAIREMQEESLLVVEDGRLFFPPESFYRYQSNIPNPKRRTYHPGQKPRSEPEQKKILKEADSSASPSPSPSPSKHMSNGTELFESFWSSYPRKEGKAKAREAFTAATKKVPVETIAAGLKRRLHSRTWTDPKFIPLPATWLNQERWTDEIQTTANAPPAHQPFKPAADEDIAAIEKLADFGG